MATSITQRIQEKFDQYRSKSYDREWDWNRTDNIWSYFISALGFNCPWTVSGYFLDTQHIYTYSDRYFFNHIWTHRDAKGFRNSIVELICGVPVYHEVTFDDYKRVLSIFAAGIVNISGQYVIPDAPSRREKIVSTARIKNWFSDAARSTGADAMARAYMAGVPYEDIVDENTDALVGDLEKLSSHAEKAWYNSRVSANQ